MLAHVFLYQALQRVIRLHVEVVVVVMNITVVQIVVEKIVLVTIMVLESILVGKW